MFTSPSQILFTIFGVNIYYYGVIMALAIACGTLVSDFIGTKYYNFPKDTFIDIAPYVIISGIIGARLYYCLMDYDFYLRFPTEIVAIRHGGMSIHGAVLGGWFGLWIFSKRRRIQLLRLCDISAIGLSIGQAIGRWGNFFNSEAYGAPTNLPWKLYIAPQYRQVPFADVSYYHPAFLYESILDIIIFFILVFFVNTKVSSKSGNLALIYLILYSIARILVETCRIDSVRYIFGIPVAIIVSAGIIIISGILLFKVNK